MRAWPQIQADLGRLESLHFHVVDYAAVGELAVALIGELQAAYVRLPRRCREVLLGLIDVHRVAMRTAKDLGGHGLPRLAAQAVQQCAEALNDTVWLGRAAIVQGYATGELDRAGQYRRSVAAAETLTATLDSGDAVPVCGTLHLMAALAARMDTEVGTWANLFFGPTSVGEWRTHIALELGEHGQALEAAKTVHPELLPTRSQAFFWSEVGRALCAGKKTRHQGVYVLLHAEHLAPQLIHTDVLVRETVADLLRQARREAGGRELRGLAWRMRIAPLG